MAEPAKTTPKTAPEAAENTATRGDHDRVAMLSLRADGSPDQIRPELLDEQAALAASRQQFVEQAVSAADAERASRRRAESADEGVQDPSIAEAQREDEATAKAAEAAAEKTVKALSS